MHQFRDDRANTENVLRVRYGFDTPITVTPRLNVPPQASCLKLD